jgi:hypothetical protein
VSYVGNHQNLVKVMSVSVNREVRYARSFLIDLKNLEPTAYQRVYDFVFIEFAGKSSLHCLPELRQLDSEGIFHRFTLDNYLIGIEIRGQIVKFLRVIPMPDV